jgi:hypothetical protein
MERELQLVLVLEMLGLQELQILGLQEQMV